MYNKVYRVKVNLDRKIKGYLKYFYAKTYPGSVLFTHNSRTLIASQSALKVQENNFKLRFMYFFTITFVAA